MFKDSGNNITMCLSNKTNASCHQTHHLTSGEVTGHILRCVLALTIITLHSLKIATVTRTRSLRTVSNFFKCGLSIGGTVFGLSAILHAVLDMTHMLNQAKTCRIVMVFIMTSVGVTMSSVLLMYIEGFLVTHYTIMNRQVFSKRFAVGLLGATWLLWVLLGVLNRVAEPVQGTVISSDICHLNNGQVSNTYIMIVCVIIIAHILVLISLQVAIYLRIKAHANKFKVKTQVSSPDLNASRVTLVTSPGLSILETPPPRSVSSEVFTMNTPQSNNVTHFEFSDVNDQPLAQTKLEHLEANMLHEQREDFIPLEQLNKEDKSLTEQNVKLNTVVELHVAPNSLVQQDGEVESMAHSNKENNTQTPSDGDQNMAAHPNVGADISANPNTYSGNTLEITAEANLINDQDEKLNPADTKEEAKNTTVDPNVKTDAKTQTPQSAGNQNRNSALQRRRQSRPNMKIYKTWMIRVSKLVCQMSAILAAFLVCYIPFLVTTLLNMTTTQKQGEIMNFIVATGIGINPILNFIVFVTVNEEFRAVLIKMLLCKT